LKLFLWGGEIHYKKERSKEKKQQGERESRGAATGPDRDSRPLALATSLDLAIAKL
jgi:hypothetical protein